MVGAQEKAPKYIFLFKLGYTSLVTTRPKNPSDEFEKEKEV